MSTQSTAGRTARGNTAIGALAVAAAAMLFGTSGVVTQLLAPGLAPTTTADRHRRRRSRGHQRGAPSGTVVLPLSVAGHRAGRAGFARVPARLLPGRAQDGVATATIVSIGTGPVVAGLLDRVRCGTVLRARWCAGVAVAVSGIAVMTGAVGVVFDPLGCAAAIGAGCCFPFWGIRTLPADRPALTVAGEAGRPGHGGRCSRNADRRLDRDRLPAQ